jgi:flagellar basal-body rod protein FlgB
MDPTRSTPIALAERRLAWLDARQKVLAQNVANADTPGYRPRDLRPFAQLLASRAAGVPLVRTDARHVGPAGGSDPRAVAERRPSDLSVSGNAVSLDEQAVKVAETDTAHALAMGLHRRYLGLFRAALGRM